MMPRVSAKRVLNLRLSEVDKCEVLSQCGRTVCQSVFCIRASSSILEDSSLTALQYATLEAASPCGGVMVSTGLLVAERHAGVWTPVIAHKTISAEPQFALAA